jgi:HEAT repeat protein
MRTLLILGLVCVLPAAAQEKKKPEDPKEVLARLLSDVKQTSDAPRQLQAAMGLADFGPDAAPALPALLSLLERKHADMQLNEDLHLNAAIALGKIGKAAVAPLQELIGHTDKDVRFYAIWALGWVGPDAKAATTALVKAMADKDEGVRRKAAYALGRITDDPQQTLTVLFAAFKDSNEDVREAASDAVAKFGKEALPGLMTALKDADPIVRAQAAHAVTAIGTDARATAPLLRDLLLAKDESYVNAFSQALGKLGRDGVPALIEGFKDNRPNVRHACMQGLQAVGADAVPALVDALGDKNVEVRRLSAQVLAPLRVGDKMVVTALAYAIKNDTDDAVRQQCVIALQYLGASGKLAAPALQHALSDPNHQVRQQAFYALQNMGENARDGLLKALASKDDAIRINTAALMLQVGVEVNQCLPVLTGALKHENDAVRMQAAHALAQAGRELGQLLPFFSDGLSSKTARVRQQALQGLQMLGGNAKALTPRVVAALKDSDNGVRMQAIHTLQNVAADMSPHLPDLIATYKDGDTGVRANLINLFARAGEKGVVQLAELLRDPDDQVRWQAAAALQNVGPHLPKVIPALIEATHDKNANVRIYAMYALARAGDEGAKALVKAFGESKEPAARQQIVQAMFSFQNRNQIVPLLKQAVKDPAREVRITALQHLPNLGPIQEVMDILTDVMKDKDVDVRIHAVYSMQNFGPKGMPLLEQQLPAAKESALRQVILQGLIGYNHRSKTMVAPLTEYLKDAQPQVRSQAAQVLGNIGPEAASAVPTLKTLLNDPDVTVRQQAQLAINRCAPQPKNNP